MDSQHEPPQSDPSVTPRRGWWLRPIVTLPAKRDRDPTFKETAAYLSPCWGSIFTVIIIFIILNFLDAHSDSHPKFSIQSLHVAVPPSSTTWHVDFLVENPSSRYTIYYDVDDVSVGRGSLNAAVLNITHKRDSRDLTTFSLEFVAEEGRNYERVLDVKLRGQHKHYASDDDIGYFHIRCQHLTRRHPKIICRSSFTIYPMIA